MSKNRLLPAFLLLSLLINILTVAYVFKNRQEITTSTDFAKQEQKYPLLSKRILREFPQDILINFLSLRTALRKQVASYGDNKFGVYFEYLPTGTSVGVNEKNEFHAASLFKLPVIMAYYRWRERTGAKEDPVIEIKPEHINKEFGNLWKKGPGYKIKLSEAVRLTIEESDNTAAQVIQGYLTEEDFNAVYQGLDIELDLDNEGAILTAKHYSSILKALYFSAVLNKDDSEQILDLLTKTNFPDKLAAGVPANVPVAHKIGNFEDKSGNLAFSDCGIIYVPKRPYALCMVSISDEMVARERMQEISKMIYDYVSSR